MFDSLRYIPVKWKVFSTITVALIILVVVFADSVIFISNAPLHFDAFENVRSHPNQLWTHQSSRLLRMRSTDDFVDRDHGYMKPGSDVKPTDQRLARPENMSKFNESHVFETSDLTRRFDARVRGFFGRNRCRVQIFMTWISPVDSFGEREFFGLDSLFQTNPRSCLVILSSTMDSEEGYEVLRPLLGRGFRVRALTPDLWGLFSNTPAEDWFKDIKNGNKDPGYIPFAQNLSNLIRLAVLYKYGGVYFDTDFVFLRDFSGLRNSIGAQSTGVNGNWTRLNNAVLIFDKNHPLVYKFMEEFNSSFNGNIWGHNGPYLVSRVVDRLAKTGDYNFTILSRMVFYPVYWSHVGDFFSRPKQGSTWIQNKIRQLNRSTYGVHLWNRQSRMFKIEEGSIVERLVSDHCVVCGKRQISSS